MGVIAEAVRHMLAAGMDPASVADAVAAMEAALPIEGVTSQEADAVERKRLADRERMRRKREAAKAVNEHRDDRATSQKSREITDCRATSATSRDSSDPSLDKMSPRPPKNYSLPSSTPSVPNGTSCPIATDCDPVDRQGDLGEALAAFNRMAAEVGLPTAQMLSRKRRASLRHRLAECGGLEGWRLRWIGFERHPFSADRTTAAGERAWISC